MKSPKKIVFGLGIIISCISLSIILFFVLQDKNSLSIIWTNQAEFAMYTELFNASQNKYKIIVEYKENPAKEVYATKDLPNIVIGPWLKTEKSSSKFTSLDSFLAQQKINTNQFYKPLLQHGLVKDKQFFLPVSFNIPAIVFANENQELIRETIVIDSKESMTISLEEIRKLSKDFNVKNKQTYNRMGFSPRWDSDFLYLVSCLYNTEFTTDKDLFSYNAIALNASIDFIRDWTLDSNTSSEAEDDFKFKYLYDPPYKLITSGRCLFSYMQSNTLFSISKDKLESIDFKWIHHEGKIPIDDSVIYLGLCKSSKHDKASQTFIKWFLNEKTQFQLLDRGKKLQALDHSFGISGGFSSITAVNEKVLPLFYPHILGQLAPSDMLEAPNMLSFDWNFHKNEIIIPWLVEKTSYLNEDNTSPSLESKIVDWKNTH